MRIDILTILPELLESPFKHSILKRASKKGLVEIHVHNIRDYAAGKHKQVDDYAFGGGAGMVMMIEPIEKAINKLKIPRTKPATPKPCPAFVLIFSISTLFVLIY